ncbi:heterokaryon incompatibility protein-domain-containing protein [Phaeosphaeria sp. MPI-PUGE-AT-0046c]|nr:heterokaryon incompatibility protein-domain-containing protein [Phaeosphaeria sp. MPI-PUGE-AT-0046c]
MPTYQYTPLDIETGEIRIVQLHPGDFADPVRISIIVTPFAVPRPTQLDHYRLDRIQETLPSHWRVHENIDGRLVFRDTKKRLTAWTHPDTKGSSSNYSHGEHPTALCRPSYEALSYVWGTENAETLVQVVPSSHSLPVRQNLYDAMKHLRKQRVSRFLWVDAISINQVDVAERNRQVRRMGNIYKYASRVIVWLGLASPGSSTAMGLLRYLGDHIVYTKTGRVLAAPLCDNPDLWTSRDAQDIESNPAIWHTVYRLLQRPWFDRLWILQEIQLANTSALIQCGNDTISWVRLRSAIRTCAHMRYPEGVHISLHKLAFKRAKLTYDATELGPLGLLGVALSAGCEDMRDKLYALLGLFPEAFSRRIQPRYDRPALYVHREAVYSYVECTGSLDILLLAGPSWTPNWSVSREFLTGDGLYSSGQSEANISCINPDELTATGIMFDTVKTVAGPLKNDDDKSIVDLVGAVWLKDAAPSDLYPTGENLGQACAWSLNFGRLQDRWRQDSLITTVAEASLTFQHFGHDNNFELDPDAPLLRATVVEGSFIFKTRKGYVGFSCQQTMPGDKVAVLLGSSCPVILREKDDGRYIFIGCAYVHGIMDGEALLGPLNNHSVIVDYDSNGEIQVFVDASTKTETLHDPRLGALPAEWDQIVTNDRLWPERKVRAYKNSNTGEILFSDPRLLPAALTDRGVPLQHLSLV